MAATVIVSEESGGLLEVLPHHGWLCPDLTASVNKMYGEGVSVDALHGLVDRGLAESCVFCRCARCPSCSTHQCIVWERCVRCESSNLTAVSLFHHIPCAGIFEAPKGLAAVERCEKCRQAFDEEDGNMVEAVGETYWCNSCGGRSPEPNLAFKCLGCQQVHAFDAVTFHRLWQFKRASSAVPSVSTPEQD